MTNKFFNKNLALMLGLMLASNSNAATNNSFNNNSFNNNNLSNNNLLTKEDKLSQVKNIFAEIKNKTPFSNEFNNLKAAIEKIYDDLYNNNKNSYERQEVNKIAYLVKDMELKEKLSEAQNIFDQVKNKIPCSNEFNILKERIQKICIDTNNINSASHRHDNIKDMLVKVKEMELKEKLSEANNIFAQIKKTIPFSDEFNSLKGAIEKIYDDLYKNNQHSYESKEVSKILYYVKDMELKEILSEANNIFDQIKKTIPFSDAFNSLKDRIQKINDNIKSCSSGYGLTKGMLEKIYHMELDSKVSEAENIVNQMSVTLTLDQFNNFKNEIEKIGKYMSSYVASKQCGDMGMILARVRQIELERKVSEAKNIFDQIKNKIPFSDEFNSLKGQIKKIHDNINMFSNEHHVTNDILAKVENLEKARVASNNNLVNNTNQVNSLSNNNLSNTEIELNNLLSKAQDIFYNISNNKLSLDDLIELKDKLEKISREAFMLDWKSHQCKTIENFVNQVKILKKERKLNSLFA